MILLPYLLSFILGWLIIAALPRRKQNRFNGFDIILCFSLGLGACGLLTFASFIAYQKFSWTLILLLYLAAIITILIKLKFKFNIFLDKLPALEKPNVWTALRLVAWSISLGFIIFLAYKHKFGEWDAWALWNMKTKFLILGDSWKIIFDQLHWHTQPDYPLLLPMINVYTFSFYQHTIPFITFLTSIVLTGTIILAIYFGLNQFMDKGKAFLGSILVGASPYFILLSTAQYADTLFALLLLLSLICLTKGTRNMDAHYIFLTGIFLGLLTFTKNEGIAISVLIVLLMGVYTLLNKEKVAVRKYQWIKSFALGLLITGSITIGYKIFIAPENRDISIKVLSSSLPYMNIQGISLVGKALLSELTHERWCNIWYLCFALVLLRLPRFFRGENLLLTLFFCCYFTILIFIYLTTANFDLQWRLKSTLARIFFYLFPSIIFTLFYVNFQKENKT